MAIQISQFSPGKKFTEVERLINYQIVKDVNEGLKAVSEKHSRLKQIYIHITNSPGQRMCTVPPRISHTAIYPDFH
jgi:hypothetical protein